MQRAILVLAIVLAVGVGAVWFASAMGLGAGPPITQPVAFNHQIHMENGLECGECHAYFTTQTFSGLPGIQTCLDCHEDALTDSPEEEKIRQAAAAGEELVWNQIYTVPDHVYYSHRRHVVAGGMECAECHGPIAETTSPPERPLNRITMDFCMDCHRRTGMSLDCIACHT